MNNETKQYFRTEVNNLDNQCNLISEIIEDQYIDFLEDNPNFELIYQAINTLQFAITNYQLSNKYI